METEERTVERCGNILLRSSRVRALDEGAVLLEVVEVTAVPDNERAIGQEGEVMWVGKLPRGRTVGAELALEGSVAVQYLNAVVIPVCAAIESELSELEEEDKLEFMADLGLEEPGLNLVIRGGYELLKLQTYFTAGVKEVRAWTIPVGATAPQAAGKIHTDFERGFIRAQTIAFDDYIAFKGESGAKEAGKMRQEGKEYIVKDGDVMNFLFNV